MAAAGGLALFGGKAFAAPGKTRIGVLAPSHCALPVLRAQGNGLFKKYGVAADVVFAEKMDDIVRGIAKGELEFGQLTTSMALAMGSGYPKLPKVAVGTAQVLGANGGSLSVSTKADVKKLADLKGKAIGVHSPLLVHSLILNLILAKSGIDPEKDMTVKVVPMGEMAEALKEGRIDGFINPEPIPTMLETEGIARTLVATKTFWVDHPCCVLAARKSFFEKEKGLVRDVTMAGIEAGLELDDPLVRKKAITDVYNATPAYQQIPLPVLLKAFDAQRTGFYPFPYRSAGLIVAEQMKARGLLGPAAEGEGLVAEVFASELSMEVFREAAKNVKGARLPSGLSRKEKIISLS
jgi:ABC-type nitrate/sulfonate/bicarbonate transport system substrate-binding protein